MAGEKDMSLPVFIPLNVVMLFISVSPLYLQGFGLLVSKLWKTSLLLETFSFGLSLMRSFDCQCRLGVFLSARIFSVNFSRHESRKLPVCCRVRPHNVSINYELFY
jgi:hypothetical protein